MNNEKPLYIFDIDGTLSNLDHRLHFINFNASMHGFKKDFKPDWDGFHDNVYRDEPILQTIRTAYYLQQEADIWFFTGRKESCRQATEYWLRMKMNLNEYPNVTMRPENDYRPDYEIKQEMYDNMLDIDKERLIAVFDDRQQIVDMWRRNNVMCYQVADGKY